MMEKYQKVIFKSDDIDTVYEKKLYNENLYEYLKLSKEEKRKRLINIMNQKNFENEPMNISDIDFIGSIVKNKLIYNTDICKLIYIDNSNIKIIPENTPFHKMKHTKYFFYSTNKQYYFSVVSYLPDKEELLKNENYCIIL